MNILNLSLNRSQDLICLIHLTSSEIQYGEQLLLKRKVNEEEHLYSQMKQNVDELKLMLNSQTIVHMDKNNSLKFGKLNNMYIYTAGDVE